MMNWTKTSHICKTARWTGKLHKEAIRPGKRFFLESDPCSLVSIGGVGPLHGCDQVFEKKGKTKGNGCGYLYKSDTAAAGEWARYPRLASEVRIRTFSLGEAL